MNGPPGKVVARYVDGTLIKGYSYDFAPGRRRFHIFSAHKASAAPTLVQLSDLKAVFFVRDFSGNAAYTERNRFAPGEPSAGRRVKVVFRDNEVLVGSTDGELASLPGLFVTPADPASNNIRVYAVSTAIRQVRTLSADRSPAPASAVRAQAVTLPLPTRVLAWLRQPIPVPRLPRRRRVSP
jgi:Family of unknown function (DUF6982)